MPVTIERSLATQKIASVNSSSDHSPDRIEHSWARESPPNTCFTRAQTARVDPTLTSTISMRAVTNLGYKSRLSPTRRPDLLNPIPHRNFPRQELGEWHALVNPVDSFCQKRRHAELSYPVGHRPILDLALYTPASQDQTREGSTPSTPYVIMELFRCDRLTLRQMQGHLRANRLQPVSVSPGTHGALLSSKPCYLAFTSLPLFSQAY